MQDAVYSVSISNLEAPHNSIICNTKLLLKVVIMPSSSWGEHADNFDAAALHRAYFEDTIVILFVNMIVKYCNLKCTLIIFLLFGQTIH
jgi:hypothetical protein